MDFHLTKEQLLVRKMYREFAENEVKPLAAEIDEEERFPRKPSKDGQAGYDGHLFPQGVRRRRGDVLSYAMALRNWPRSAAPLALSFPPTLLCAALPFMRTAPRSRRRSICLTCAPASGSALSA